MPLKHGVLQLYPTDFDIRTLHAAKQLQLLDVAYNIASIITVGISGDREGEVNHAILQYIFHESTAVIILIKYSS